MKKFLVAMGLVAFAVVGCDDSSSASAENSEPAALSSAEKRGSSSSSRHCEECNDDAISSSGNAESNGSSSSSSEKAKSSSSGAQSDAKRSSSSEKFGKSSSSENESSSSSVKQESTEKSSSSEKLSETSSSSADKVEPSSSSGNFDWSIPKEAYLNSEIQYDSIVDERDGLTYKTIKIDEQTWMAQNLNYADSSKTPSLLGKSWCFDNDPKNCDVGGRLYTWAAAIDSVSLAANKENPLECGYEKICGLSGRIQGICPNGWHLPDSTEWEILFAKVGGQSVAGMYLKSKVGWHNNGNGLDLYGFSALPTGCMLYTGNFYDDGLNAYFWSSSERKEKYAYESYLYYEDDKAGMWGDAKRFAKSVRCLKD